MRVVPHVCRALGYAVCAVVEVPSDTGEACELALALLAWGNAVFALLLVINVR